jgi:hypothetical protein
MNNKKLAAVLKKHNVAKAVRANGGYVLAPAYNPELSVGYYHHLTAQSVAGLDRVAAALKAEGINFKRTATKLVIL